MELGDDDSSSCHEFHGNNIDTAITGALSEDRCCDTCSPPNWIPGDECVICMEKMVTVDQVSHLPVCHHSFHQECISKWFITKISAGQIGRCPICNLGIVWALQVQPEQVTPTTFIEHGNRNNRKLKRVIAFCIFILILLMAIVTILKWDHIQ